MTILRILLNWLFGNKIPMSLKLRDLAVFDMETGIMIARRKTDLVFLEPGDSLQLTIRIPDPAQPTPTPTRYFTNIGL